MSQQINLYNPALFPKRDWLKAYYVGRGLLVLALVLILLVAGLRYQTHRLTQQAEAGKSQAQARQAELQAVQKSFVAKQPDATLVEQVRSGEAGLQRMQRGLVLLRGGSLGRVDGFSSYMAAFSRQVVPGVWLTHFTVAADGAFELRGRTSRAELVPDYLGRLQAEKVLADHKLAGFNLERAQEKDAQQQVRWLPYLEFSAQSQEIQQQIAGGARGS